VSSGAGGGAKLVERATFHLRGSVGDFFYVGWFATFAAIRNRREVRTICLEHKAIEWSSSKRVAHILAVLEGDNAGEAYQGTEIEDALHDGRVAGETMKNAAQAIGKRSELGESVFERVALMNDAV